LRREISETTSLPKSRDVKTLLVTTGGADPAGMALSIVRFLHLMEKSFETVIVAGPAFQHRPELEQAVAVSSGEFRIENEPDSLPTLIAQADLAITAFGVTAYELAAMGVPAAYLCLTLDHVESASAFVTEGLGISLGLLSEIDATSFRNGILPLLRKPELRQQISQNGKRTVDGRGARRISALIARHLQGESGND
jgi:spore coat polysaccharide biosynthesis protein SpsF